MHNSGVPEGVVILSSKDGESEINNHPLELSRCDEEELKQCIQYSLESKFKWSNFDYKPIWVGKEPVGLLDKCNAYYLIQVRFLSAGKVHLDGNIRPYPVWNGTRLLYFESDQLDKVRDGYKKILDASNRSKEYFEILKTSDSDKSKMDRNLDLWAKRVNKLSVVDEASNKENKVVQVRIWIKDTVHCLHMFIPNDATVDMLKSIFGIYFDNMIYQKMKIMIDWKEIGYQHSPDDKMHSIVTDEDMSIIQNGGLLVAIHEPTARTNVL